LVDDVRAISRSSPSTCEKIKYSNRNDTLGSCPASDHRWSARQARLLAPHRTPAPAWRHRRGRGRTPARAAGRGSHWAAGSAASPAPTASGPHSDGGAEQGDMAVQQPAPRSSRTRPAQRKRLATPPSSRPLSGRTSAVPAPATAGGHPLQDGACHDPSALGLGRSATNTSPRSRGSDISLDRVPLAPQGQAHQDSICRNDCFDVSISPAAAFAVHRAGSPRTHRLERSTGQLEGRLCQRAQG
jgi:hypothetical protein